MGDERPTAWAITTLEYDEEGKRRMGSGRTPLVADSLQRALWFVENRNRVIWDPEVRYVVIEEFEMNSAYPRVHAEHWYEWIVDEPDDDYLPWEDSEGYFVPCDKPEELAFICNFGIG